MNSAIKLDQFDICDPFDSVWRHEVGLNRETFVPDRRTMLD